MYCTKCGNQLEDKMNYCSNCGNAVVNYQEVQVSSPNVENPKNKDLEIKDDKYTGIVTINGIEVDLYSIIRVYGNRKLGAVSALSTKTKISWTEAKQIMEEAYTNFGSLKELTFMSQFREQMRQNNLPKKKTKKQIIKERKQTAEENGLANCSKCGSTSLSANKKGFGIGKAVVGGGVGLFALGPVGLLGLTGGNLGAKKVRVTCMNCGHEFWAGKR